jgi:hypothetical protein
MFRPHRVLGIADPFRRPVRVVSRQTLKDAGGVQGGLLAVELLEACEGRIRILTGPAKMQKMREHPRIAVAVRKVFPQCLEHHHNILGP